LRVRVFQELQTDLEVLNVILLEESGLQNFSDGFLGLPATSQVPSNRTNFNLVSEQGPRIAKNSNIRIPLCILLSDTLQPVLNGVGLVIGGSLKFTSLLIAL
jgi:hypothetical protein